MSDLIDEIKEDVKVERIINFLKNYANHIISIILIAAVVLGGYLYWQSRKEQQQLAEATIFDQAQQASIEGKNPEAIKLLSQLSNDKAPGYKVMALFQRALLETNTSKEKANIYLDIMNTPNVEPKFKDLAVILWGYEGVDRENPDALRHKLQPLAEGKGPWADSAQEILSLIDINTGNTQIALKRLQALISKENTTPGIRRRAFSLFEQLGR